MKADRYPITQHSYYPTILLVTQVLSYFFYCSYTWAVEIITGVFPLCICCSFRVIRFLFFGTEQSIFAVTTLMLKDEELVDQESS
jgi:hypothetical protein